MSKLDAQRRVWGQLVLIDDLTRRLGEGSWHNLHFELIGVPAGTLHDLRWDPLSGVLRTCVDHLTYEGIRENA